MNILAPKIQLLIPGTSQQTTTLVGLHALLVTRELALTLNNDLFIPQKRLYLFLVMINLVWISIVFPNVHTY